MLDPVRRGLGWLDDGPHATGHRMRMTRAHAGLVALIVLVALNLRPSVTAVGPLLTEIESDLRLSGAQAGLLTTLPVLCFGVFGLLASRLRRRIREESLLIGAMALLVTGVIIRSGPGVATLLTGALVVGIAISIGNVVLPAIIKREQPDAVTLVTSLYSTALTVGAAVASGVVVPIEEVTGSGWRLPLLLLAIPAVVAGLAWVPRARGAAAPDGPHAASGLWRDPLAWQVTLFFGLQSLLAYAVFAWLPTLCQDRGMTKAAAGLVLAVSAGVQSLGSLGVPLAARRLRDQRPLVLGVAALSAAGFAGVVWAPIGSVWGWAVVLGIGQGASFAVALSFIGLRSGDAQVAGRLSGMSQGVGYLIAAMGPLGVGALHDHTGGWSVPVVVLLGVVVLMLLPGLGAGRTRTICVPSDPGR